MPELAQGYLHESYNRKIMMEKKIACCPSISYCTSLRTVHYDASQTSYMIYCLKSR